MSDEQLPTPTQPYRAQPLPIGHDLQPYAQSGPPRDYAAANVPIGGTVVRTSVVKPRVGSAHLVIAWLFTVFTIGYFLPWAIAATRQKSNTLAIGLLNLLVGWTLIGWIAALVMAVMSEPVQVTTVAYAVAHVDSPTPPPPGWYPDQHGLRRYWDGRQWTEHTVR